MNDLLKQFIVHLAAHELYDELTSKDADILKLYGAFEDLTITKIKKFGFYAFTEDPLISAIVEYPILDDEMFKKLKANDFKLYKELAEEIKKEILNIHELRRTKK